MHLPLVSRRRARLRWVAGLAALPLLATACSDRASSPGVDPVAPDGRRTTILACTGSVKNATVQCAPGTLPAGGARYQQQILGGQGVFVRLTSSAVTYTAADSIFAFDMTVQNLIDLAMGTSDGTTRHADGVRVFFHQEPTVLDGPAGIDVVNATGMETFTASNQSYFQYGGAIGGVDQPELGADGILASAEVSTAKQWRLRMDPGVNNFSFLLLISTHTVNGNEQTVAPQVSSVSVDTMVPGASVVLTGVNFSTTPANNTVTIGGRAATVTAASATQLTVTVPCVSSGDVPVQVTTGGMKGAASSAPLKVAQRTVGIGQALVLTSASESACNELTSANGAARYIVSIFNNSTSPTNTAPFEFSADLEGAAPAPAQAVAPVGDEIIGRPVSLDGVMDVAQAQRTEARHLEILEKNREAYVRLRAEFGPNGGADGRFRVNRNRDVVNADPPLTRTFRVPNINGSFCSSFYVVSATRVYYNGKVAIYEDDATPDGFKAALNPTMASNYLKIGDQFNADMEPIVRNNFGDILRRDAVTDADGAMIALFTPRLNTSFPNVAGFVVSCDQFPNNDTTTTARPVGGPYTGLNSSGAVASNGSSNFGEYFYAYQPVTAGTGYSGNTADNWYRTIRSTFIHESKHVASQAARVANGAPSFEQSWLEEGTARHVEELWLRNAVDNLPWKGNTGFGSFANPINVYCDLRPTAAECIANPRRPSVNMLRHLNPMFTFLLAGGTGQGNSRLLSPFGATPSDNSSFWYAISWSLVRYSIDRYGVSDADFLTALTQSNTNGVTNLTARAGVSLDQLLGGWSLALTADDHPLLAGPASPDIQFPTWNLRDIFAGLNADPNASGFTPAWPSVPVAATFGSFTPAPVATLRGGGYVTYEISGTQAAPQLLRLTGASGAAIPSTVRVAVTRIQ
ncbi:MAG TPA: IPT/TIG domain-containing protein [Longimicrobium sp.]|nr:IPT/TIG domain-containing protein [Longimicrobium sp.]